MTFWTKKESANVTNYAADRTVSNNLPFVRTFAELSSADTGNLVPKSSSRGVRYHTKFNSYKRVLAGMDSASPRPTESLVDSLSEFGAFTLAFTIKLAEKFTFGGNTPNSRLRAFERAAHATFESADPPTMGAERPHVTL